MLTIIKVGQKPICFTDIYHHNQQLFHGVLCWHSAYTAVISIQIT